MTTRTKKRKEDSPKKTCVSCKKPLVLTNFYNTNSKMMFPDGKAPLCKPCIKKEINYADMNSVYNVLRQLDIPFIKEYWDKASESDSDTFGNYIRMANSLPQFKGMTWQHSSFDTNTTQEISYTPKNTNPNKEFVVTDDLIDKWGSGYQPEEYKQFERKYKKLINNYGEKTALHTEGLLTYIRYRVKEEMSTASGNVKEAKEWGQLASKAAQDAKINVSQLSKSDISGGVDVLSQLFEAVESEVGIIPLLPKLLEQPYDDADLIIWATVNYNRRLDDKSPVQYRDVWNFYDEMLEEHFKQQGFNEEQVKTFKAKRNNVFRDLSKIYVEPLYEGDGEE